MSTPPDPRPPWLSVVTNARHHSAGLFAREGFLRDEQLHHPFLVLDTRDEHQVAVVVERFAKNLLIYPDATLVLVLWPGQHRSDYFAFTVAQIRPYLRTKP